LVERDITNKATTPNPEPQTPNPKPPLTLCGTGACLAYSIVNSPFPCPHASHTVNTNAPPPPHNVNPHTRCERRTNHTNVSAATRTCVLLLKSVL